jgi:thiol-disulfide isomerase/thioredoxin
LHLSQDDICLGAGNGVRKWLAEKNNSCPVCRFEHEGGSKLVVVLFHASWCAPCRQTGPAFRRAAMESPTARFLKVNIEECDKVFIY